MPETTVTAPDGATITVESHGHGPGVVVVHGGAVSAKDYRRLARALAERCTVHLYNRRGRPGGAALPPDGYTVEVDVADLGAVLAHTGAERLFGHSIGGFIALHAALTLPVTKVGLYDAAIAVDDEFPTYYLDDFEAAVKAKDYPLAIAVVGKGLRAGGAASDLPMAFQKVFGRLFMRTPIGKEWMQTIHTVPAETREAANHGGPASLYEGVTADVLLATGTWSPPYYVPVSEKLAAAMKSARFIRIPRLRHDAPNIARPAFVEPFAEFFTQR